MKIEKGIPLPPKALFSNKGRLISPYHQMEVGDSIFFPNQKGIKPSDLASRKGTAARSVTKKTNKKFTVRQVEGGVRIWRVE